MANDFGFTRDRDEARALRPHLNELPRSVVRPDEYELLDGEWRFAVDLDDVGLSEKWQLGHEYEATALWPGSIEAHMAEAKGIQQRQHDAGQAESASAWTDQVIAWYERDFAVPDTWARERDRLIQVTFGACGYETRVWLNGHLLRTVEGEDVHFGEYTSFSYEVPPEHLQTVNRLTVRIADSLDAEIPRGKQQSTVYKRGGIWYQTYTGAVRSVCATACVRA